MAAAVLAFLDGAPERPAVPLFYRDRQCLRELGRVYGCGDVSPRAHRPTVVDLTPDNVDPIEALLACWLP